MRSLDALSAGPIIGCIILVLAQGQGPPSLLHQQRVGLPDGGVQQPVQLWGPDTDTYR